MWIERHLTEPNLREASFVVVDVHTGLGPWSYDTLFTPKKPSSSMLQVLGTKIEASESEKNIGYKPTGGLPEAMEDLIQRVTACAKEKIFLLTQEFGVVSNYHVIVAMRNEASATREKNA